MTATVPVSDREAEKTKILNRLRRLEGQIRGLQKMVEEEKGCVEVMSLYASAKSAFESTGDVILETYVEMCQARGEKPADLVRLLKLAR
ncbi:MULTISPECIES: metal-sensitive transcriptional regulator [Deinococcus]|jgi:DNA-binding FrmR family transcriptional regulator|uniref:Metal-sensitive transcriptional regulator n=1 Tax=Deinococcus terrestris TaxID=2651870 RepID=A0A7X1TSN5_9DEIO|nr:MULTISPECIES: metal-sensitive transcriptional regulator [Deinococcus]MPY68038.1 metal-sensitive transcriptional regulator [Deinococcus terrestris]